MNGLMVLFVKSLIYTSCNRANYWLRGRNTSQVTVDLEPEQKKVRASHLTSLHGCRISSQGQMMLSYPPDLFPSQGSALTLLCSRRQYCLVVEGVEFAARQLLGSNPDCAVY